MLQKSGCEMMEAGKAEEKGEQRVVLGGAGGRLNSGCWRMERAVVTERQNWSLLKGLHGGRALTVEMRTVTNVAEDSASGIK